MRSFARNSYRYVPTELSMHLIDKQCDLANKKGGRYGRLFETM
jgi:hypothetical protein